MVRVRLRARARFRVKVRVRVAPVHRERRRAACYREGSEVAQHRVLNAHLVRVRVRG